MSLLWFLPVFIFIYMSVWFVVSRWLKRRDVIDIAWGAGFVFLAWITFLSFRESPLDERSVWLLLFISLWGLRLSIHTSLRNLNQAEDWRYHDLSDSKLAKTPFFTFIRVFMFQGALMMIISLPIIYSLRLIALPLFSLNYFGILLLLIGLFFESVADGQRFLFLSKSENKSRLITGGLWRYSRHPNYFGECLFWWGIYFLVFGAPKSWMLIISPLTITYILLFVSGLPMEERYRGRPDFEAYKRRTSAFIPWFPKNNKKAG